MAKFIKGLKLSELFYTECVKQILDTYYPNLQYSAGLIGGGSEVLGFDTPLSSDHDWGARLLIFLTEHDYSSLKDKISEMLSMKLPYKFYEYSTSYGIDGRTRFPEEIESGPVNHFIDFYTIESYFKRNLGINPYNELSNIDWLTFQEHKLLGIASGRIFYDGLGELNEICDKFSYYPKDIWLYLLASQWARIAQERAFMGRCGDVGDELGSHIIASRLVRDLMRLCFLMEKKYVPYNKWFGSAFSKLGCSNKITPILTKVMQSNNWKEREQHLSLAYNCVAKMHNDLNITDPLSTEVSNYFSRPYLVINADEFVKAILNQIEDEEIKSFKFPIGSINQFVDSTDVLCNSELCNKIRGIYT